jgi:hypothetical protein
MPVSDGATQQFLSMPSGQVIRIDCRSVLWNECAPQTTTGVTGPMGGDRT